MNIYLSLFQASVTLAGFIAVFLVFRYRQIDTYVDARKEILISSLLKGQIDKAPYIAVIIEEIGKKHEIGDTRSFFERINEELTENKEELDKKTKKKKAVEELVNHIFQYRKWRKYIVCLGLGSIFAWGLLALVFLLVHVLSPCLFNNTWCSGMMVGISICLFIISMIFTLFFVCFSLRVKRPEYPV